MALHCLFSTVDETLWEKTSTLRHLKKKYFLCTLYVTEIQWKVKFMSSKISSFSSLKHDSKSDKVS